MLKGQATSKKKSPGKRNPLAISSVKEASNSKEMSKESSKVITEASSSASSSGTSDAYNDASRELHSTKADSLDKSKISLPRENAGRGNTRPPGQPSSPVKLSRNDSYE